MHSTIQEQLLISKTLERMSCGGGWVRVVAPAVRSAYRGRDAGLHFACMCAIHFLPSCSPIACLPSHPLSIIAETRCYESGGKFHAALAPYAFEWVSVCGVS